MKFLLKLTTGHYPSKKEWFLLTALFILFLPLVIFNDIIEWSSKKYFRFIIRYCTEIGKSSRKEKTHD